MEGSQKLFQNYNVDIITVEFWPYGLRKAGASAAQLLDLFVDLDLPVAIIDHIEHQLVASSIDELKEWAANVDKNPEDQGFMNIYFGELPNLDG